ncbi:cell division protein ZapA [Chakrabartyella piscis]|uniref:cell division protein ZapA n=1 Tax=Chakrabartyella piscis TaxID=2918914 RepID=UPI00295897ED|nr:cell division protein ZapA [Chakrabartyella piscis]
MRNSTRVTVDGKSFMLRGESTVEHIQQVAEYVDAKMAEIRRETVGIRLDPTMAYILTALNITDDFIKAENKVVALENDKNDLENENEELRKVIRTLKAEQTGRKTPAMQYSKADLNIVLAEGDLEQEDEYLEDEYAEDDTYFGDADDFDEYEADELMDEPLEEEYEENDDREIPSYIEELEDLEEIEIPRIIRDKMYAEPEQMVLPYAQQARNARNARSARNRKRR